MRTLVLLSVLIVPLSVYGQTNRLTGGEKVLMATAGIVVGSVALAAGADSEPLALVATAPAAGFVVYGVGQALGNRGRFVPTMVGAGLGALPGLALIAATEIDEIPGDEIAFLIFGAGALLVLPSAAAVVGFDRSRASVAPAVLAGPGGERAAGFALRVAL